ncbi:hypothetical protein ACQCN2_21100 [Brevibacillus ginsengisoli]|uniref:hypothetical protein n=1 Tax=Brevibacillus ginsengisoli TaxID=363854 RepID=UPI003CF18124
MCLAVILAMFSMIVCIEMYTLERAIARSYFQDLLDDMQDIGYLDNQLANYYRDKMAEVGWEPIEGDFFVGSTPRDEVLRAHKEQNELIHLTMRIRPSKISEWMNLLFTGEPVFQFSGRRPSEYFSPGW